MGKLFHSVGKWGKAFFFSLAWAHCLILGQPTSIHHDRWALWECTLLDFPVFESCIRCLESPLLS